MAKIRESIRFILDDVRDFPEEWERPEGLMFGYEAYSLFHRGNVELDVWRTVGKVVGKQLIHLEFVLTSHHLSEHGFYVQAAWVYTRPRWKFWRDFDGPVALTPIECQLLSKIFWGFCSRQIKESRERDESSVRRAEQALDRLTVGRS